MTRKAKFSDLSKHSWRRVRAEGRMIKQTYVKEPVLELYQTRIGMAELITRLKELDQQLEDMTIDLEHDAAASDWDSCTYGLVVRGWRDATDDEVEAALAEAQETLDRAAEWQERQIAMLKKQRPELFKD